LQIEIRGAERLSFRERQVVTLKEMGMGNPQVAKRLGVTQGTVATLYNRAKKKGYQVVIVISGDPLALFDSDDNDGETDDTATEDESE
jgi:DNA-binding transcriptional regulator LsrR (DeoR family)